MRVALLAPEWDRPCAVCETYLFRADGTPVFKQGLPVLRPEGAPTPCDRCAKVPADVRASGADWKECRTHAADPTEQSRRAWQFYRRCKAVGRFPDDPLVAWYAAAIADVERRAAELPLARFNANVELLAQLLLRKGR